MKIIIPVVGGTGGVTTGGCVADVPATGGVVCVVPAGVGATVGDAPGPTVSTIINTDVIANHVFQRYLFYLW